MGGILRSSKWSSFILSFPLYTILKLNGSLRKLPPWYNHSIHAPSMWCLVIWLVFEASEKESTPKPLPHISLPTFYGYLQYSLNFFFFLPICLVRGVMSEYRESHLCPRSVLTCAIFCCFQNMYTSLLPLSSPQDMLVKGLIYVYF